MNNLARLLGFITVIIVLLAGLPTALMINQGAVTQTDLAGYVTTPVTSAKITDGTIVAADISGSAGIDRGQLATNAKATRSGSYVIAASNAPAIWQSQADVIASATNLDSLIEAQLGTYKDFVLSPGAFGMNSLQLGTYSNLTISGQGADTILTLNGNVNTDAVLSGDNSTHTPNVTLQNFTLVGNSANQSAGSGIHLKGVESAKVRSVTVTDAKVHGIHSEGAVARHSVYFQLSDSYVHDNLKSGVYLDNYSYGALISKNVLAGNGSGADEGNLRMYFNSDHTVTGNLFDVGSYGIKASTVSLVTVSGNTFLNQQRDAIFAYDGGVGNTVWTITGNTLVSPSNGSAASYNGIRGDFAYSVFSNNNIYAAVNALDRGIKELAGSDHNSIIGNVFQGTMNSGVYNVGANDIVRDNLGYVTENSGLATVANGTTSIAVTHGLSNTPTRVQITPAENPTNAVSFWWVDGLGATQFTIHTNADPGASNLDFHWRAVYGEGN